MSPKFVGSNAFWECILSKYKGLFAQGYKCRYIYLCVFKKLGQWNGYGLKLYVKKLRERGKGKLS